MHTIWKYVPIAVRRLAGVSRILATAVLILVPAATVGTPSRALPASSGGTEDGRSTSGAQAPHVYPSCRFGITIGPSQHQHFSMIQKLSSGLYLDFGINLPAAGPSEAEYVPMIRVHQGGDEPPERECGLEGEYEVIPALDEGLGAIVDANLGSLWIIGNEPDRWRQDDICPQQYAQGYHDAYVFIKGRDPTAQIATAGLVEVTPMRTDYLDRVLAAYEDRYEKPMPVDVWAMHIYILSESNGGDAHLAIGADKTLAIPYSDNCSDGGTYCHAEHDDMNLFKGQVVRMRQWMKDNGYRDKPLIITEFGILKPFHFPFPDHPDSDGVCSSTTCPSPEGEPDCFCDETNRTFDPPRVSAFMVAAFDYLRTKKSSSTGFPADENRLVQQWLWYRLATDHIAGLGHPSNLVDPAQTGPDGEWELTLVGQEWQDYVQAITPTVNLRATAVPAGTGYLVPGGAVVNLAAHGVNNGNVALTETVTVTFYSDEGLTTPLGTATLAGVPGCARREVATWAHLSWPGLGAGEYNYWFVLDDPDEIAETPEDDNVGQGTVRVFAWVQFLPLAMRDP